MTGFFERYVAVSSLLLIAAAVTGCLARQQEASVASVASGRVMMVKTPGAGCTLDGVSRQEGASWTSADGCQQCRCLSGLTFCDPVKFCHDLGQCGVVVTRPGACCPVCYGCVTPSGRKVSLNETWMEDDCTTCVCHDGQTKCQASFCRTPCLHPRKVPGECCPVCDDDCHLECLYGRATDAGGRELCECRKVPDEDFRDLQVTIKTRVIEPEEHDEDNDGGDYVTDSQDGEQLVCPRVPCKKTCQHGFQKDRRGCPICKCQRCQSIQPCRKKCPLGLVHDARGCPTCRCRSAASSASSAPVTPLSTATSASSDGKCFSAPNNATYNYGDRWQADDCTQCLCHPGGPTCTEMACPLPCHHPDYVPGQCCPLCGGDGLPPGRHQDNHRDDALEADGATLRTVVIICVSLVVGLLLIVAILGVCVAKQCQRIQLHEENMAAAAAVKLTAVNRLRPKSTNLDYQYTLYMQRYREATPGGMERTSESHDNDEGGSSQCSNSPLLVKNGQ